MTTAQNHLTDANGKTIIGPGNGNHIRLIGGPMDGKTHEYRGGVLVEMMNPDYEKWGPTERLAYVYHIKDNELVGVFPS